MRKRTTIILTVIFTIISLVIIFASYYGINRYLYLHVSSSEKYIENYSKLPKRVETKIVIAFTTTPNSIGKIKPMINSILDQTMKVDSILLFIPYKYKKQKYDTPKYIKDVAQIVPCEEKHCDTNIVLPCLLKEKEHGTYIMILKDNIVYGQDFIYTMLSEGEKYPGNIILDQKNTAILFKPEYISSHDTENKIECLNTFLEHYKNKQTLDYIENYKILGM